jgi:CO/xanthine dehydrogenase FAD-binding subunit
MWTDYLFPKTLEEAVQMLAIYDGRARIIAGGTDLVLQAQRGQCDAQVMVDITAIEGLDFLEEREGWILVGPQVTHAMVASSPLVREKAGLLAGACASVGGPQLRQVATLVGNVVNALPAADGAVALFALDAEVEIIDQQGRRWESITGFYEGVGQCGVDPCHEVVGAIRFRPLPEGTGWDFQRLARRRSLILPMLCAAVALRVKDGLFADPRIAIGPVAPIPFRARAAEDALGGAPVGQQAIGEAARLALEAAAPRDSLLRGSGEYRKQMVEVLVRRGLVQAAARAQGLC